MERVRNQQGNWVYRHFFAQPDKSQYTRIDFKELGHNIWINQEKMAIKLDLEKGIYAGRKRH